MLSQVFVLRFAAGTLAAAGIVRLGFQFVAPCFETGGPLAKTAGSFHGDIVANQTAQALQFIRRVRILHLLADRAVICLLCAFEKAADFALQCFGFLLGAALVVG